MIYLLDLFGIAVFAISGALAAGRKKMDMFGIVVVALVTTIGGGTLRDIILGIRPVFWVGDPASLIVASVAAVATFLAVRFIRIPHRTLLLFDAFGLALFTVLGCQRSMAVTDSQTIIVVMGILTGVAGGMIRDLLCGEIPVILRGEIYATASLLGGITYVGLRSLGGDPGTVTIAAIVAALGLRLAAIHWRLSLPIFNLTEEQP